MSKSESELERLRANLRRARDELRVKIHLAAADARDEWDELERKWEHVESRLEGLGSEAKETAKNVGSALSLALDELKSGYERLRKRL